MSQQVLHDIRQRHGIQESLIGDSFVFQERNPLDQTLLHQLADELVDITGAQKADRVRITVLGTEDYNRALREIVPRRLIDRGLGHHFRVLADPRDPHHIFVGPSALSGLNDRHPNVMTDLIYHLIAATGKPSSLAFERGAADLLAAEIARRFDLNIFTDQYPQERRMLEAIIGAIKGFDEPEAEIVGLLKRSPTHFFRLVKGSGFYRWWEGSCQADERLAPYVGLVATIASPAAQMEASFMAWAESCAALYRDYRLQQRANAIAGAQKRQAQTAGAAA